MSERPDECPSKHPMWWFGDEPSGVAWGLCGEPFKHESVWLWDDGKGTMTQLTGFNPQLLVRHLKQLAHLVGIFPKGRDGL